LEVVGCSCTGVYFNTIYYTKIEIADGFELFNGNYGKEMKNHRIGLVDGFVGSVGRV
jgi:hypothetical protein